MDSTVLAPNAPTIREQQVLLLLADGLTTKEISASLGIAFKTVVSHRSHLITKLGARNCANLVLLAIRNGFIAPFALLKIDLQPELELPGIERGRVSQRIGGTAGVSGDGVR